jgi:hypothetical protein
LQQAEDLREYYKERRENFFDKKIKERAVEEEDHQNLEEMPKETQNRKKLQKGDRQVINKFIMQY